MSGPNTTGRGVATAESPLLWHMVRLFGALVLESSCQRNACLPVFGSGGE